MTASHPHPARIYQLFYSEQTRPTLDPGFLPLDNTNQRPDWREYWPIRNFLHHTPLDDNALYGFFSPKFKEKTGLDSSTVFTFLSTLPAATDVVSFSPFFDQGAYHLNTLQHSAGIHPNIWPAWEALVPLLAPGCDPHTLLMDSRHSIFCNYFVARPAFWRIWLEKCELVFAAAEHNTGPLYDLLNFNLPYDNGLLASSVSTKVFIIERIVSLLLATDPSWRIVNFDPISLPVSNSPITRFAAELIILDALKQSANVTGRDEYMRTFHDLRAAITKAILDLPNSDTPNPETSSPPHLL